MSNDGNQVLLGRLAVHKKLITMEQLVEATAEQGRFGNEGQRLGEILVGKGFLSAQQLEQLLALQRAFVSELSSHADDPSSSGTASRGLVPKPTPPKAPPPNVAAAAARPGPAVRGVAPAGEGPRGASPTSAGGMGAPDASAAPAKLSPSSGPASLDLDLDRSGSRPSPVAPPAAAPPAPVTSSASDDSLELDLDRSGARSWSTYEDSAKAPSAPAAAPSPAPSSAASSSSAALSTSPAAFEHDVAAPAPLAAPPAFAPPKAPSASFEIEFTPAPTLPAPEEEEPAELLLELEEEAPPLALPPPVANGAVAPSPPSSQAFAPAPPPAPSSSREPSLIALSAAPGRAERLDAFLSNAARGGASDVHFHPGAPAKVRSVGALVDTSPELLEAQFCEEVLTEALNGAQRALLEERGQIDFAYSIPGIGRFRANLYRGQTGLNGVFRFVPSFVPSLVQLGLPTELSKLTTFHQGLVLVTGPAGCGKSTTLASLVNIINEERSDHILTIEDPVEYLHPSKRCLVNQRQVSRHTESFARALRAALREDPDVIVIGELRDLETISLALTAAETGHLVLGTLHTSSAIRTVNRLIGAYPPDEQPQIRSMLSESLRAVLSQRLLPRQDGQGRVSALEVLHVNKAVANTIRENKSFQLRSMMQTGRSQGMLLLDQSLQDLVKAGVVSKEEAARHVEDPRFLQ